MKNIHLIVFTGWPADGKSSLSKELENYGFKYVGTDTIRKEIYPNKFPLEIKYPDDWENIWNEVCSCRDELLCKRNHVIIDSCAQNKYIRDKFFTVPAKIESYFESNDIVIRRELVHLHISEDERVAREKNRGRNPHYMLELMDVMKTDYQNPRDYRFENVEFLEYQNSNLEEQKEIINNFITRLNSS